MFVGLAKSVLVVLAVLVTSISPVLSSEFVQPTTSVSWQEGGKERSGPCCGPS